MGQTGFLNMEQHRIERRELSKPYREIEEILYRLAAVVQLRRFDELFDKLAIGIANRFAMLCLVFFQAAIQKDF